MVHKKNTQVGDIQKMATITHQAGLARFMELAQQFSSTGTVGADKSAYPQARQAEQALSNLMDGFIKSEDNKNGIIEHSIKQDRGGLPFIVFEDVQLGGTPKEGYMVKRTGLAPNVPDGITISEFSPTQIRHFQVEFDAQEGFEIANLKGVHIDRVNPDKSYQETLAFNVDYPKGIFES